LLYVHARSDGQGVRPYTQDFTRKHKRHDARLTAPTESRNPPCLLHLFFGLASEYYPCSSRLLRDLLPVTPSPSPFALDNVVYMGTRSPAHHRSATKTKTRPAGVAQSVERVALIFSDISKPQGRGFEPLLRLFLSHVAGASFLSMSPDVSGMVIEWWWKVRIFFFFFCVVRGWAWDRVRVGLDGLPD
jgi:hypothetical protein